jgi:hypothetical protein
MSTTISISANIQMFLFISYLGQEKPIEYVHLFVLSTGLENIRLKDVLKSISRVHSAA